MVSIIIPTYNRADKLKAAIMSVLNQTYCDLELIIVDDGSTDDTKNVVANIDDNRLRYVYQKKAGACVARNNGIEEAHGDYIAFHDSDDVWHLDKLEEQISVLQSTDADIVFCKMAALYRDGSVKKVYPAKIESGFLKPITTLFDIGTQTIIGKKEVFKEFRFNPIIPRYQEFELLFSATKKYSIYCLDKVLVDYIVGEDSISVNSEKLYKTCGLILELHPEILTDYPLMRQTLACNLLTAAYLEKKKKKAYQKYCKKALKIDKSLKTITKTVLIWTNLYQWIK